MNRRKEIIKQLQELNEEILCQLEEERQMDLSLDSSLLSRKHKTPTLNTSHLNRSSDGSKKAEEGSARQSPRSEKPSTGMTLTDHLS